jgi:N-acetylglucosamine-1-phosphate transferase gamma subunit
LVLIYIYRYDFTNGLNNREFKSAKTHASNFSGPSDLEHLLGKCFLYSNDKYNYRVCPFDNVTQHEKLWQGFNGYNGIIGIWKEWKIINNSFDSLMYYSGDDWYILGVK